MKTKTMIKGAAYAILLTGLISASAFSQTKPKGHKEKKDTATYRSPAAKPAEKPVKTTKKDDSSPAKTPGPAKSNKKN
jgi:hypothetical protein